ncbi:MAG: hypothetical protein HY846_08615 [Nitrosomonadales bacterium]|nr:hypothetical protein [Nitrosomonadales bacterium]
MKLQDFSIDASQRQGNPGALPMPVSLPEGRLPGCANRMDFDGYGRCSHPSAIWAIQRQRGQEPCFSTDKRYSCAQQCEWRKDCMKLRAVWLR